MNRSHWNYRVFNDDGLLAIHSAYYDGDHAEPVSWSVTPAVVVGESVDELEAELSRFREALAKPIVVRSETPAIDDFAVHARAFVSLLAEGGPLDERTVNVALARLYVSALALPDVADAADVDDHDVVDHVVLNLPSDFGLGIQLYATTADLDPLARTVCGDLDDDLRDIARDLARGLALFDAGAVLQAAWCWRLSFDTHWGTHTVEALRVLHRVAR